MQKQRKEKPHFVKCAICRDQSRNFAVANFWVFGIITLFSVVRRALGLVCQCEQDDGPDELILQQTPLLLLKVYE